MYLVINHGYVKLIGPWAEKLAKVSAYRFVSMAVTFVVVVLGWVYFRAHTFNGAAQVVAAMTRPSTFAGPGVVHPLYWNAGLSPARGWLLCLLTAAIAFLGPNSNRIGDGVLARCRADERVRFMVLGAALLMAVFFVVLAESRGAVSAFIYFNF
jgi:hypothetical protein